MAQTQLNAQQGGQRSSLSDPERERCRGAEASRHTYHASRTAVDHKGLKCFRLARCWTERASMADASDDMPRRLTRLQTSHYTVGINPTNHHHHHRRPCITCLRENCPKQSTKQMGKRNSLRYNTLLAAWSAHDFVRRMMMWPRPRWPVAWCPRAVGFLERIPRRFVCPPVPDVSNISTPIPTHFQTAARRTPRSCSRPVRA
jgi:hypothetical protein